MRSTRSASAPRVARLALVAAFGAALSACYVVPIDPRSGPGHPVAPPPAPIVPQPPVATTLTVRLYPLNPQANQGGLLTATVVDTHAGRGSFSVGYLGDTLQGEATRVAGRRGIANAHGPRGVGVQCEYQITGPSMGTGSCLFSDGARYQMHFGG